MLAAEGCHWENKLRSAAWILYTVKGSAKLLADWAWEVYADLSHLEEDKSGPALPAVKTKDRLFTGSPGIT